MATPAARCHNCRHSILNVFIDGLPKSPRPRYWIPRFIAQAPYRRLFGVSPFRHQYIQEGAQHRSPAQEDEAGHQALLVLSEDLQKEPFVEERKPWYLQLDMPQREQRPLLDRQKIPKLPPNPPPLLRPMLDYVSVDLGMDDLAILDLRHIDPPAALGANLLMVIGTARSEKHLHVSAERFCRWLKTDHHILAHADGLIGRGELKVKLRRKMRRAKLLSRVGSSEMAPVDDGIRTGWICVNVRDIQDGLVGQKHQDLHDEVIGFGADSGKANIIIQLLTLEKREDLDLEQFWGRISGSEGMEEMKLSGRSMHLEMGGGQDFLSQLSSGAGSRASRRANKIAAGQMRPFSTWTGPHFRHAVNVGASRAAADLTTPMTPHVQMRRFHHVGDSQSDPPADQSDRSLPPTASEEQRLEEITSLFDTIKATPVLEVQPRLDVTSQLWKSLDEARSLFPSMQEYWMRLAMHIYAQHIGAGNHKAAIAGLMDDIQATCIDVPDTIFTLVVKSLLRPPVSETDLLKSVEFVESMNARGHAIPIEDIRLPLQAAVLEVQQVDPTSEVLPHAHQNVRHLMNNVFGYASVDEECQAMHDCADAGRWDEYWTIWRGFPWARRRRTREVYVTMYQRTALRQHQAEAMKCLRECVPDMELEEPAVEMDVEIAKAIMACLLVAAPDLTDAIARKHPANEWASLWRRCEEVISDNSAVEPS